MISLCSKRDGDHFGGGELETVDFGQSADIAQNDRCRGAQATARQSSDNHSGDASWRGRESIGQGLGCGSGVPTPLSVRGLSGPRPAQVETELPGIVLAGDSYLRGFGRGEGEKRVSADSHSQYRTVLMVAVGTYGTNPIRRDDHPSRGGWVSVDA